MLPGSNQLSVTSEVWVLSSLTSAQKVILRLPQTFHSFVEHSSHKRDALRLDHSRLTDGIVGNRIIIYGAFTQLLQQIYLLTP
jgi:hypothetical protein